MCKYLYNDLYTTKNLEQCKTTMLMTTSYKDTLNDKTQLDPRSAPAKP